jgi:hypothetical protein
MSTSGEDGRLNFSTLRSSGPVSASWRTNSGNRDPRLALALPSKPPNRRYLIASYGAATTCGLKPFQL